MDFPYGKAPLALLLLSIISGALLLASSARTATEKKPDLIFATTTKEHAEAYSRVVGDFERQHNVKVQIQLVDQTALRQRLLAAMQAGADVPDMVEILYNAFGSFVTGPLDKVGFADLTDRVDRDRLREKLVASRFGLWSDRGRVFALPHDVHPVMLVYRKDLVESLGIDVNKLTTWDEFCRIGREIVTKDLNGDGIPDRYMLDLQTQGGDMLRLLMLQRGVDMFTAAGDVAFDNDVTADVICWYVRAIEGKNRIAFPAGWGQPLSQAMRDGLCLFYICPDWRSNQIRLDIRSLSGKLGLMPLPAWTEGGPRTSSWGGTGLAFTKQCERNGKMDLAWQLAMFLYYNPEDLGRRFVDTHILPPLKDAWTRPEFDQPNAFYGGVKLGRAYADLAPQVPAGQAHAYMTEAINKMSEAYENALIYYREHGEDGLHDYTMSELRRCADAVRATIKRNPFIQQPALARGAA